MASAKTVAAATIDDSKIDALLAAAPTVVPVVEPVVEPTVVPAIDPAVAETTTIVIGDAPTDTSKAVVLNDKDLAALGFGDLPKDPELDPALLPLEVTEDAPAEVVVDRRLEAEQAAGRAALNRTR